MPPVTAAWLCIVADKNRASFFGLYSVSVPLNSFYKDRVLWVFFDTLTNIFNMYTNKIGAAGIGWIIPYFIKEEGRGEDFIWMGHQVI